MPQIAVFHLNLLLYSYISYITYYLLLVWRQYVLPLIIPHHLLVAWTLSQQF